MDTHPTSVPVEQGAIILLVSPPGPRRDELAAVLQSGGFRPAFPPSADEAIACIQSGDLLVVLADAITGRELAVLDTIRGLEAGWHVPALVVTAGATPEVVKNCIEHGALDCLSWPVNADLLHTRVRAGVEKKRLFDTEALSLQLTLKEKEHAESLISSIIPLAEAALQGKEPIQLLEMILVESMRITDCEGGSVYLRTDDDCLRFVLVRNDMLDINMGGSVGKDITFEPLRLHDSAGKPNSRYVANHAVLTSTVVSVADAYSADRFDFSGTKQFDARTGYRSKSFLTVPLRNRAQRVIGALQLINARDPRTGVIGPFNSDLQPTIEALGTLATAIMETYRRQHGQLK